MTTEAMRAAFEKFSVGMQLENDAIYRKSEFIFSAGWQAAIEAERERVERVTREWWEELRKGETP